MNPPRVYCYEIRVEEPLAPCWSEWFSGMEVSHPEGRGAVLRGCLPDQAALFGVLARIRDLNLTLVSVQRL